MFCDIQQRGGNFLTAADGIAFTGDANFVAKMAAFAHPETLPIMQHDDSGQVQTWGLKAICMVYKINLRDAHGMLVTLVQKGQIQGTVANCSP